MNFFIIRKAAGGIANFLMTAIAFVNGTYLKNGYGNLTLEMKEIATLPEGFKEVYHSMIHATTLEEIKKLSYQMLSTTRRFFLERKPKDSIEPVIKRCVKNIKWENPLMRLQQSIVYHMKQQERLFTEKVMVSRKI